MFGRIARLREELLRADCDVLVALGSRHAVHLAGYDRYLSDLSGALGVVVTADGHRTLVVGRCEVPAGEADAHADAVIGYGDAHLLELDPVPALVAACRAVAGRGRVAVAGPRELVAGFAGDGAVAFDTVLDGIRRRKDADEVERVAQACALAVHAQAVVERGAAEGRTEIELFAAAHAATQEAAGRPVGWIATVAAGPRSALISPPFCVPEQHPVTPGAPVLCDIAVRHRGYWADTARTYGGGDDVADVRRELVAIGADLARAARPGVRAAELFALARDAIAERLPGAELPHHAGHSIGVDVGERPQILPGDPIELEDDMILALEPGAYFAGRFGVRVEETYHVGPEGARRIDEVPA